MLTRNRGGECCAHPSGGVLVTSDHPGQLLADPGRLPQRAAGRRQPRQRRPDALDGVARLVCQKLSQGDHTRRRWDVRQLQAQRIGGVRLRIFGGQQRHKAH